MTTRRTLHRYLRGTMFGLLIPFFIEYGPTIITVVEDVSAIVGGYKTATSIFSFLQKEYPKVADIITEIGKALPGDDAAKLDNVSKALLAWSPEQIKAMKAILPQNTGCGSIGYNQNLNADA